MNFIAILGDGTTDTSIVEQEVVYVFFVDPDTVEPTLTFSECQRIRKQPRCPWYLGCYKGSI